MINNKTLEEALKESREKRREFLKKEIERNKKQKRKDTILTIIIALFMIIMTINCLKNINDKYMNDCMNNGHSQLYCERGM